MEKSIGEATESIGIVQFLSDFGNFVGLFLKEKAFWQIYEFPLRIAFPTIARSSFF